MLSNRDPDVQFPDTGLEKVLTHLEMDIEKTSKTAAVVAQNAAMLAKELQGFEQGLQDLSSVAPQVSLKREASPVERPLDLRFDDMSMMQPQIGMNPSASFNQFDAPYSLYTANPEASIYAQPSLQPGLASPIALLPLNSQHDLSSTKSTSDGKKCGGDGQVKCNTILRLLTFGYQFNVAWSIIFWVLILLVLACNCFFAMYCLRSRQ